MSEFTQMDPDAVTIGERFREEYGDLEELAADIKARGILQPIVVNQNLELCAGGRRLAAFKLARAPYKNGRMDFPDNLTSISVHVVRTDNELELREIELIENFLRKDMSWSESIKLQKRIHELMLETYPDEWTMRQTAKMLSKSPGAMSDNLQLASVMEKFPALANEATADSARKKFKRALEQAEVKQDVATAIAEVAARDADITNANADGDPPIVLSNTSFWLQVLDGAYRIEDAIEGMLSARSGSAHFAEVDPPYGVDLQSEKADGSAGLKHYNEVPRDQYEDFLKRTCEALFHVLADDAFVVFWHAPTWSRETLIALRAAGFKVDDIPAIWNKIDTGAAANNPDVYLGRAYEPFFVARKGQPVLRQRGRKNVFDAKPIPAAQKFHPTERPIPLIREVISTFLYPGARVIVPFLGSGNSIIAAYQEGAKMVWGFDLSEHYRDSFMVKARAELMHKSQREYELEALERIE